MSTPQGEASPCDLNVSSEESDTAESPSRHFAQLQPDPGYLNPGALSSEVASVEAATQGDAMRSALLASLARDEPGERAGQWRQSATELSAEVQRLVLVNTSLRSKVRELTAEADEMRGWRDAATRASTDVQERLRAAQERCKQLTESQASSLQHARSVVEIAEGERTTASKALEQKTREVATLRAENETLVAANDALRKKCAALTEANGKLTLSEAAVRRERGDALRGKRAAEARLGRSTAKLERLGSGLPSLRESAAALRADLLRVRALVRSQEARLRKATSAIREIHLLSTLSRKKRSPKRAGSKADAKRASCRPAKTRSASARLGSPVKLTQPRGTVRLFCCLSEPFRASFAKAQPRPEFKKLTPRTSQAAAAVEARDRTEERVRSTLGQLFDQVSTATRVRSFVRARAKEILRLAMDGSDVCVVRNQVPSAAAQGGPVGSDDIFSALLDAAQSTPSLRLKVRMFQVCGERYWRDLAALWLNPSAKPAAQARGINGEVPTEQLRCLRVDSSLPQTLTELGRAWATRRASSGRGIFSCTPQAQWLSYSALLIDFEDAGASSSSARGSISVVELPAADGRPPWGIASPNAAARTENASRFDAWCRLSDGLCVRRGRAGAALGRESEPKDSIRVDMSDSVDPGWSWSAHARGRAGSSLVVRSSDPRQGHRLVGAADLRNLACVATQTLAAPTAKAIRPADDGDRYPFKGLRSASVAARRALANVLRALRCRASFVPYRDSRTTWFLRDILSPNSRIFAFTFTHPEVVAQDFSPLNFANRVRNVEQDAPRKTPTRQSPAKRPTPRKTPRKAAANSPGPFIYSPETKRRGYIYSPAARKVQKRGSAT